MASDRRPLIRTAEGTNVGRFEPIEWAMLVFNSTVWGASFLLIAIGLDAFTPGMIALARMALGALVLAMVRSARVRVERRDWGAIAIVSIAGNAGPALLFAAAEQTVESSVAGMLSAAVPIMTAAIAFSLGLRSLTRLHVIGLVGGLGGVVLLSIPSLTGSAPAVGGVAMAVLAVFGYSVTNNVMVPLVQKYSGITVILWAQTLGVVLLVPFGMWGLGDNEFAWGPALAIVALGVLSTGVARTVQAALAGRVGAPRVATIGYLVPVVALIAGVVFRDESLALLEVLGLAVALAGAFLSTRALRANSPGGTNL